jgi:hypothetical protein
MILWTDFVAAAFVVAEAPATGVIGTPGPHKEHLMNWKGRVCGACGLNEIAAVSDGLSLAFGLVDRATPAVAAGVAAVTLRTVARLLPGCSGCHKA